MFQMRHGAGSIRASWSLEMSKDAAYGVLAVRVFFFSSRRRHTRFDCDWSSDVCSSDLGGELAIRGFVQAFDAKTGETLWRTYTIPAPGEPGSDTWSGDDWKNGGGSVWIRSEERRVGEEGRSRWSAYH